jgi:hypothetical protein
MAADAPRSVQDFLQRPDEDESVRKWKESLLGDAAAADPTLSSPPNDPRRVIAKEFKIIIHGGATHTYNLEDQAQLTNLKKKGYHIKEGQTFHYEVTILVHHEIVLGIKLRTKSKKLIGSQEALFEIGSYPPTIAPIVKELEECEVPSGALARGEYKCVSTIEDDMGRTHFRFDSRFVVDKA